MTTPSPATPAGTTAAPTTLYGATFVLPADWTIDRYDTFATIRPPQPGLQIDIAHFDRATDPADLVAALWKVTKPGFKDPLASRANKGAVRGWDDDVVFTYDPPASEGRMAVAAAYRHGSGWTVFTADASLSVLETRGAELSQFLGSITPEGYVVEDLTGRTAHPLDAARLPICAPSSAKG